MQPEVKKDEQAQAAAAGPGGEEKPAQPAAQPAGQNAEVPTPKALADMMAETPELKTLFDQKPEVKGKFFAMARKLAEIEPIAEIFPSLGDAQYAQENAAALIGMQTASMRAANDPKMLPGLLDMFDKQFAFVDEKGQPVLDAQGKPTFAPDRQVFIDGLINREQTATRTNVQQQYDSLKQKLGSQAYPNPAAKALDEKRLENLDYALTALQIMDQIRTGEFFEPDAPALPADASEEMKAWFQQEQENIKKQRDELQGKKDASSQEQKTQERTTFNTKVRNAWGNAAGRAVGEQLKQKIDAGVYIPEFYLQEKWIDPKTGQETNAPAIGVRIFNAIENELMKEGSRTARTIAEHEMLPVGEKTERIRNDWYAARAAELAPKFVQKEIERIQKLVKADHDKLEKQLGERSKAAQPEPQSAGTQNAGQTQEQLLSQAEEAAKKLPEWKLADSSTKQAMVLTQLHRLRKPGR